MLEDETCLSDSFPGYSETVPTNDLSNKARGLRKWQQKYLDFKAESEPIPDEIEEWISARQAAPRAGIAYHALERLADLKLVKMKPGRWKFEGETRIVHRAFAASEMDLVRQARESLGM